MIIEKVRRRTKIMDKLIKALVFALAAAVVTKKVKEKKPVEKVKEKVRKTETAPDILKPLSPISKTFWLFHPKKAMCLFLFQTASGIAWTQARKYFKL